MNYNTIKIVGVGMVVLGSHAFAIDRPDNNGSNVLPPSPEPSVHLNSLPDLTANRQSAEAPAALGKSQLLLGVLPGEMPEALKAQMNLDGFSGVLVEDVIADSPAEKAGVRKYDVITKVGDKPISQPIDMRAAIAQSETGDKVVVEFLRAMKPHQVEVVLDQTMSFQNDLAGAAPPLRSMPKNLIDDVIGAGRMALPPDVCMDREMEDMMNMLSDIMSRASGISHHPSMAGQRIERLRRQIQQMQAGALPLPPGVQFNMPRQAAGMESGYSSSMFRRDNQGTIEIKNDSKQGTRLTVKDNRGNVIFDGPYSTDSDKSKVPAHIRERIDGICINMQFR